MALKMNSGGDREYETPPKGSYAARLVDVWDEGWRDIPHEYRDSKKGWIEKHELRLTYLVNTPMSDGRPFAVSEWVRINQRRSDGTTADGALYKDKGKVSNFVARVEAISGKDIEECDITRFDTEIELMESLIGQGCLVTVTHNKNGKAKVSGVVSVPHGLPLPPAEFKRKKDRDREEGRDPIEDMDEKKRMNLIWGTAERRAKELGDPITKESIVRNLYEEFKITGGTHEAVKLPANQLRLVIESIEGWEPTLNVEPEDQETPF